jgi:hypothetical protein
MASNTDVSVATGAWTQLTADDATRITVQNKGQTHPIFIKGTTSASAPTDLTGAIRIPPGQAILGEYLTTLWPGIAAVRVYAFTGGETVSAAVSHD